MDTSLDRMLRVGAELHPDILHIGCLLQTVAEELLLSCREAHFEVSLLLAAPMNQPGGAEKALQFDSIVDYFISDTGDPERADVDATGETHDRELSKDFV